MATEVKHGPGPTFEHEVIGDPYGLTIVGRYTTTDGWTAGGVTDHVYASDRDAKRLNELLGMRTIFLNWWLSEWVGRGGRLKDGATQLVGALNAELSNRSAGPNVAN